MRARARMKPRRGGGRTGLGRSQARARRIARGAPSSATPPMSAFREFRYGARALRKSPALTVVAVLALTLGIGLTTTMFSIVYGALMKGLPFPEGDRIVLVQRNNLARDIRRMPLPIHDFVDYRAQQRSFEGMAGFTSGTVNVSGSEKAE